jgi:hypothetical protein
MRASANALANRRSSPRTSNARLNSSDSNAMSGTATSATRVTNDSGLIASAGHPPGMATMAHESSRRSSWLITLNSYSNARTWSPCHVPHTTLSSLPYERRLHRMSAKGSSSRSNRFRAENRSPRRRASVSKASRRGAARRRPTARIAPSSPPASSSRASRQSRPAIRARKPNANTPARTFNPVE